MKYPALLIYLCILAAATAAPARNGTVSAMPDAVYNGKDCNFEIRYDKTAYPGDPLFVAVRFVNQKKTTEIITEDSFAGEVSFHKTGSKKILGSASFYAVPAAKKKSSSKAGTAEHGAFSGVFAAGFPLSSYVVAGKGELDFFYSINGGQKMHFSLPVEILAKEFVMETIELDAVNTAIKTDTGVKRSAQIKALNTMIAAVHTPFLPYSGSFSAPVSATRRTSFFADRRIYVYKKGGTGNGLHLGIDYGIPEGTPVYAAADGIVTLAEERISSGNSVGIEHLPGLYSLYYHLSSYTVTAGAAVKKGQLLGYSGSTGLATGPHLHWEVRLLGEAVNPDYFTNEQFGRFWQ